MTEHASTDTVKAGVASAGLSAFGLAAGGVAGVAFLTEPVAVPLWFVLAAVALPTGDMLAVFRAIIGRHKKEVKNHAE